MMINLRKSWRNFLENDKKSSRMLKHSHRHRPHPRSPIHPCPPPASPKNKGLPTGFKTDKESKFWNGFMVFKAKIVCDLQSTDHAK